VNSMSRLLQQRRILEQASGRSTAWLNRAGYRLTRSVASVDLSYQSLRPYFERVH